MFGDINKFMLVTAIGTMFMIVGMLLGQVFTSGRSFKAMIFWGVIDFILATAAYILLNYTVANY